MLSLAGQHVQGDRYETLKEERPDEVSTHRGRRLEANAAGPPFSPDAKRPWPCRRWLPRLLTCFAILMAWDSGPTLTDRFASSRLVIHEMFPSLPRVGGTYQGFAKAIRRYGARLLLRVIAHLRAEMMRMDSCWRVMGILAFAVDGSRVECPRTAANEAMLGCAGRKKTGPQLALTTVYHVGTGCPWDYRVSPGTTSERADLRTMLAALPAESCLLADAGFCGYDLLQDILRRGQHVLFRVGSNVRLLTGLGHAEVYDDQTVHLWPDACQRAKRKPQVLRLIVLHDGRHPVYLVTDLSREQLSDEQAGVLYRLRWGVEVFYRHFKHTMEHRKMRSAAPGQAGDELVWAVAGLWMLTLLGVQAVVGAGKNPLSLSLALALRRVRQALRAGPTRRCRSLRQLLATALKDGYVRRHSKMARDWPHKKNDPPAGPPKIMAATPKQVLRAKELLSKVAAA
jgi:hypothetical protein